MPSKETVLIATMQVYFNQPVLENRAWSMKWRIRYSPSHLTWETLQRTRMAVSTSHTSRTSSRLLNNLIFRHRFSTFGWTNLLFVPGHATLDRALPSFLCCTFWIGGEGAFLFIIQQPTPMFRLEVAPCTIWCSINPLWSCSYSVHCMLPCTSSGISWTSDIGFLRDH